MKEELKYALMNCYDEEGYPIYIASLGENSMIYTEDIRCAITVNPEQFLYFSQWIRDRYDIQIKGKPITERKHV